MVTDLVCGGVLGGGRDVVRIRREREAARQIAIALGTVSGGPSNGGAQAKKLPGGSERAL